MERVWWLMVPFGKSRHESDRRKLVARDRAAKLAAIPAGESPANRRSPVTVVVISSDGKGDRTVGSLEVKVPEGWGVPSPIRAGGRAIWQAVAEANQ